VFLKVCVATGLGRRCFRSKGLDPGDPLQGRDARRRAGVCPGFQEWCDRAETDCLPNTFCLWIHLTHKTAL